MNKKIIILATGGTIAGKGEKGKSVGYKPGSIGADILIGSIPSLNEIADIEVEQICNINSDDITWEIWTALAKRINDLAKREDVTGFVVIHGTDTLEETAYFLNLTVKTEKPVVLTGAMRPFTALSADGDMNIYEATATAASEKSVGRGVLVVFADKIIGASEICKSSTYSVDGFGGGECGIMGVIRDRNIFYYYKSERLHTTSSEFDVEKINSLPNVNVIYFHSQADPRILKFAAEISDGIVIAGAGAGEFSKEFADIINKINKPVVITSRINMGIISEEGLICKNTVSAGNMPPSKAAVLLRIGLTVSDDTEYIRKIFAKY